MSFKVGQKVKLVNNPISFNDIHEWRGKIGVIKEIIYIGDDPIFICEFEGGIQLSPWLEDLEAVYKFIPRIGSEGIKLLREAIPDKDKKGLEELSSMLLGVIEDLQNELSAAYDTINERKE
jgi:hypothetical protein